MSDISTLKPIGGATPTSNVAETAKSERDKELNEPYVFNRSVTVKVLENNFSAYRKLNISVLGRPTANIGSSINSCKILSSNKGEVEAYFPELIGLSANNPEFVTRVKDYLCNIRVPVNEKVTFNNSFAFDHRKDYEEFQSKMDTIDRAFEQADKGPIEKLKNAIAARIEAINRLESELYKVGRPVDISDYILYRHVLLYNDVVKDKRLADMSRSARFYLVDETREKAQQVKRLKESKAAKRNYVELCGNAEKFNALFIRYCAKFNLNIAEYMAKDETERETIIDVFANEDPTTFNAMVTDINLLTIAFIERLIARGELTRLEHNQQISTNDGQFIGKNMQDAVAFFNNPENKATRQMYENKLKVTSY